MRVRFKTLCAGPFGCYQPDDCVELPNEVAGPIVAGGFAISLDREVERSVATPVMETATITPKVRKVTRPRQ